jgi:hypothetical protein
VIATWRLGFSGFLTPWRRLDNVAREAFPNLNQSLTRAANLDDQVGADAECTKEQVATHRAANVRELG